MKTKRYGVIICLGITLAGSAWAQQSAAAPQSEPENSSGQLPPPIQYDDVTPPLDQPSTETAPAPTPSPAVSPASATTPAPAVSPAPAPAPSPVVVVPVPSPASPPPAASSNRQDTADAYQEKKLQGIIMAAVVAPIFVGVGVGGALLIRRHALDDGGFCNHYTYDGDFTRDCKGDRGEVAGMVTIGTVSGLIAIGMLAGGLAKWHRYKRRERRLGLNTPSENTIQITSVALGREEVSVGFSF